jgi:hypothetical protein
MIPFFESHFSKLDCSATESRFLNSTVRAGSAGELKRGTSCPNPTVRADSADKLKRKTVASDRQTHAYTHAQTK